MALALPGAEEMNFTEGSSWPTYQPLSMKREAWPFWLMVMGSVHNSFMAGRIDLYLALQPLQSRLFTLLGATLSAVAACAADAIGPVKALTAASTATKMTAARR